MRAIDQVRHHAPAEAKTYRLSHKLSDGLSVTIPKVAYLPLRMSPPLGLASGTYKIHYFAASGEQIREANQTLVNATAPPAPEAQPSNSKTGEILRSYLSTLSDVEAGRLFQKDPTARLLTSYRFSRAYEVLSNAQGRESYDRDRVQWALREGAILCLDCGTANAIRRRPAPSELVQCARCKSVLPLKVSGAMDLRRARLVLEGIRLAEGVGSEFASAAAEVITAKIGPLKKRLIGKRT